MKTTLLICSVLLAALGGAMFVYGGYDDSPGGQLLGVVMVLGGIIGAWRSRG